MNLDELLAAITPERVRQAIESSVAHRPPEQREGEGVAVIVQRLFNDAALPPGKAYWTVHAAVRAAVEASGDMRYVETPG